MTRLALAVLLLSATHAHAQAPQVHLLNATIFDRTCEQLTKAPVNPEWMQEAARRRTEFQGVWDEHGPKYVLAAVAETGRPFPYREMQAYLTVCPPVGSMSMPLLVDVRPFLMSTNALTGARVPPWFFAEIVFHELMHHYVQPVAATSSLRRKYGSEALVTLNHLHVMALEKAVLSRLGLVNELKFLDQTYRTSALPAYTRAWQIVNDVEGEQAFIAELKASPPVQSGRRQEP